MAPLAVGFPLVPSTKCQNERRSPGERNPKRRDRFDPLKENMLNGFHKRFSFKIAASVLKHAGEDTASKEQGNPRPILTQARCPQSAIWLPNFFFSIARAQVL